MRKTLALLLIVVLIVSLGSGCGRRSTVQDPGSNQGENTVTQPGDKNPTDSGNNDKDSDSTSGDTVDNTGGNGGRGNGTDTDSSASGDWTSTGSNPSTGTSGGGTGTGTGNGTGSTPIAIKPIVGVYKDGTFSAHGSYDNFGWRPFVEIVISKGKIVSAKFDYSKANGQLKSADTSYGNMMFNVTKVTPAQAFQRLVSQLVSKQDVTKVDIVSGATVSSNNFRTLAYNALLKAHTTTTADSGIKPPVPIPVIPGGNSGTGNSGSGNTDADTSASEDWDDSDTGSGNSGSGSTGGNSGTGGTGTGNNGSGNERVITAPAIAPGYYATYDYAPNNGWKPFIDLVIVSGKIIDVRFDYIKPDGSLKSHDNVYAQNMLKRSPVTPLQAANNLRQQLLLKQDITKVEVVTGATSSSKYFIDLAKAAISNYEKGIKYPALLTMDATYSATGTLDKNYTPQIDVTFENGKITKVVFNEKHTDTTKPFKRLDEAYNDNYRSKTPAATMSINEATTLLENLLVEKQDPNAIALDTITGATNLTKSFKQLANAAIAKRTPYIDGTYSAVYSNADRNGWKAFVELKIVGGQVTDVVFDYITANGSLKSKDQAYATNMLKSSPVTPAQAFGKLAEQLVLKQDIDKVDNVTGATRSSASFNKLVEAALKNAHQGVKYPAVIIPDTVIYTAKGVVANNYTPEIAITFENGMITKVVFTEKHTDTSKPNKRDDAAYSTNYLSKVPTATLTIDQATTHLENLLVDVQDPNLIAVDTITGATSLTKKFKELASIALAKKAPYIAGEYYAAYDYSTDNGWKPFLNIVIENGIITSAKFDYIKPDGSLKSAAEGYAAPVNPAVASKLLEEKLLATQDITKVDVVTGATNSSNNFINLASAILSNAQYGNTTDSYLFTNAVYRQTGTTVNGLTPRITITYTNGRITDVVLTGAPAGMSEAVANLQTQLIQKQSVDAITVVAGAEDLTEMFKNLAKLALAKRQ